MRYLLGVSLRFFGLFPNEMVKAFQFVTLFLAHAAAAVPVPLIIDTDIGGGGCQDVDDVAAISIANALADNGEAELIAVLQNTSPKLCAGVISVLNTWYGREDLPIGAYRGSGLNPNDSYLPYVPLLVNNFPSPIKNTSQVPSAVDVYRKTLAAQPDGSVAISSIGLLTNLEALLKSGPDQFSKMTGAALVSAKVKVLAVMGGKYPSSGKSSECNFCGCYNGASAADAATAEHATAYVTSHWPPNVRLLFSGFEVGVRVQSGGRLSSCQPKSSPTRAAFESYEHGPNKSRFSWDPLTTLVAVRGVAAAHCRECTDCNGTNRVDPSSGNNQWAAGGASNQSYIVLEDGVAAGKVLDDLLCQTPKRNW